MADKDVDPNQDEYLEPDEEAVDAPPTAPRPEPEDTAEPTDATEIAESETDFTEPLEPRNEPQVQPLATADETDDEPASADPVPEDAPAEEVSADAVIADGGPAARDEDDADSDTETLEAPDGMGEPEVTTERVVEAVLFASDAPLPLSKIVSIVGVGSARDIRNHIKALNERYERTGASFRIEQIASGYQMLSMPVYNTWIRRLKQNKQDSRLSQAAMETLAVVAYKQPVVRADIEAIRGVSAGEMLNRLREVGLIKIVGRAEDVGRPMLYGTTKKFLEVFGLSGLEDLPAVEEMQPGQPPI